MKPLLDKVYLDATVIDGCIHRISLTPTDPILKRWLDQYLSGHSPDVDLPLNLDSLSPFNKKVVRALQKIPYGQTRSYSEIAKAVGSPHAMRAVGNACRLNPFPLVIPCHRVLRSDGTLGGYAYGLPLKRALLNFERGCQKAAG